MFQSFDEFLIWAFFSHLVAFLFGGVVFKSIADVLAQNRKVKTEMQNKFKPLNRIIK